MPILIVKLSSLGDVVQTLPILSILKKYLPQEEVHWAVEEDYAEILEGNPALSRVISVPKGFLKSPRGIWQLFRTLRKEEYSLVTDYQGLLKSGIVCGLTKAKFKVGYANHREGSPLFYTHRLPPYEANQHALRRYLQLTTAALKLMGLKISGEEDLGGEIFLPEERIEGLPSSYLVLVPSARWRTKEWPKSHWEILIPKLLSRFSSQHLFLVGRGSWEGWANAIGQRYPMVRSLFNRLTLRNLVYLIRRAEAVITVDTGPMHLASALDKPIVALFGPTAPERTGPWSANYRVVRVKVPCAPCFRKSCKDLTCLQALSPERVYTALLELNRPS